MLAYDQPLSPPKPEAVQAPRAAVSFNVMDLIALVWRRKVGIVDCHDAMRDFCLVTLRQVDE